MGGPHARHNQLGGTTDSTKIPNTLSTSLHFLQFGHNLCTAAIFGRRHFVYWTEPESQTRFRCKLQRNFCADCGCGGCNHQRLQLIELLAGRAVAWAIRIGILGCLQVWMSASLVPLVLWNYCCCGGWQGSVPTPYLCSCSLLTGPPNPESRIPDSRSQISALPLTCLCRKTQSPWAVGGQALTSGCSCDSDSDSDWDWAWLWLVGFWFSIGSDTGTPCPVAFGLLCNMCTRIVLVNHWLIPTFAYD